MNLFLGSQTERQHAHALITCKQVGGLEALFQKLLDEVKTSLVYAEDPVVVHRLQGRAQVLTDFLKALDEAPSVLERLK